MTLWKRDIRKDLVAVVGLFVALVSLLFLWPLAGNEVRSEEADCLSCHEELKKEKVVHPAVDMGCPTCHSAIDASDVPHKKKSAVAKGLAAEQPDLCYNCHDKGMFTKKEVHAAVGMGCTGCHNPHSSKNPKLLILEQPDLCYNCHDKGMFTKKEVHAAVNMGCTSCHAPHSSDSVKLLKAEPTKVCVECHGDVLKRPHAVSSFSSKGHPVAVERKGKLLEDPARPGKIFYCGSCHDPHSSDSPRLYRYKASKPYEICSNCHKV